MLPQRNRPSSPTHCNQILWIVLVFLWLELELTLRHAQAERLSGYTELHTNLPGGRHANVRTWRAAVIRLDGTGRRLVAPQLVDKPDAWTQFAGWSPDGQQAVIYRGWQDPDNARWEEEHPRFRMRPGKRELDAHLVDLATNQTSPVTAVERVSHYNGGLFFMSNGKQLGFTLLINGRSTRYLMEMTVGPNYYSRCWSCYIFWKLFCARRGSRRNSRSRRLVVVPVCFTERVV